jgi:hypothetical protein
MTNEKLAHWSNNVKRKNINDNLPLPPAPLNTASNP